MAGEKDITGFLDKLLRQDKPLGQIDSAEFRGSMSPLSLVSFHVSSFQLSGSHFFPINALNLKANTMQNWGFNLLYNSVINKMTFCVSFTEIPSLWVYELRVPEKM